MKKNKEKKIKISERKKENIIYYLKEERIRTAEKLAEKTGYPLSTVYYYLRKLDQEGKIYHPRKGKYYKKLIIDKINGDDKNGDMP